MTQFEMLATRFFTIAIRLSRQTLQQTIRSCTFLKNHPENVNVKSLIETKIRENKVMVFSKSYCPFCAKAKQVFEELIEENKLPAVDYEVMEIEDHPHCDTIQDHLQEMTGERSVPRIFINQKSLGGGNEVAAAHGTGELVKLLSSRNNS